MPASPVIVLLVALGVAVQMWWLALTSGLGWLLLMACVGGASAWCAIREQGLRVSWPAVAGLILIVAVWGSSKVGGGRMFFDAASLRLFYPWKVLSPESVREDVINVGGADAFRPWDLFYAREVFGCQRLPLRKECPSP